MTHPVRIKATDPLGNIAYVHRGADGFFGCTLANGTPASFFYAGVQRDAMVCRFALDDCTAGAEALAVMRRYGAPNYRYELLTPARPANSDPIAALCALEAEVQRLKDIFPAIAHKVDSRVIDRARTAIAKASNAEASVPQSESLLYLRLSHGRRDPEAKMNDRGSEGPVIGPLAFVSTTYLNDVKFAAAPEVMDRFFPEVMADWRKRGLSNAQGPLCNWQFDVVNDLIEYENVFYGDWTVFVSDPSETEKKSIPFWEDE